MKIGDTVKCIKTSYSLDTQGPSYIKGCLYKIIEIGGDGFIIFTEKDSNGSETNGWANTIFELYKEKKTATKKEEGWGV